jgi:hypothetical protein
MTRATANESGFDHTGILGSLDRLPGKVEFLKFRFRLRSGGNASLQSANSVTGIGSAGGVEKSMEG